MTKRLLTTLLLTAFSSTVLADYQTLDKVVAIVDNDVITQNDVNNKIAQVKINIAKQKRPLPPEDEMQKQVMDRLIIESLQMQLAQRAGVHISEEQLNSAIEDMAQRNKVSLHDFRQRIISSGLEYETYREQVRQDMALQQVQQGHLRSRIQVTEQDVNNFLQSAEGVTMTTTRYQTSHILLPVTEGSSKAEIAAAKKTLLALRTEIISGLKHFDSFLQSQNYQTYTLSGADLGLRSKDDLPSLFAETVLKLKSGDISPPIRSGAGWHLLKVQNISGTAQVVHQTKARHILVKLSEVRNEKQAIRLINSLQERLQKGEDFSLLAKEYSEDPGSSLQGGDLGWSMPGQFVPAFEKTLATLNIDETSKPFKSQYGWHIMEKLAERDHDMTQESQKNKAYQILYERSFREELDSWLLKIRDQAFIEIK